MLRTTFNIACNVLAVLGLAAVAFFIFDVRVTTRGHGEVREAPAPSGTIDAGGLRILDDRGVARIVLSAGGPGLPEISLRDENAVRRIVLSVGPDPEVRLCDGEGHTTTWLVGHSDGGGLALLDEEQRLRLHLSGTRAHLGPRVNLYGPDGRPTLQLIVWPGTDEAEVILLGDGEQSRRIRFEK